MQRDFWGIFHDGTITRIRGSVPGDVILHIEIEYLRKMFNGEGAGFDVHLSGCTKLEYAAYDEEPTSDIRAIEEREPEILYVNETEPDTVLDCAIGLFTISYVDAQVFLCSGEPVTYEELGRAAKKYWDDWGKRNGS
jgi:hypothetical protein